MTMGINGIQMNCGSNDADSCAMHGCECDSDYVKKMMSVDIGSMHNTAYKHDNGFDHSAECGFAHTAVSERDCCGDYPDRRPYRTDSQMMCCVNTNIFNSETLECCADGTVVAIGTG